MRKERMLLVAVVVGLVWALGGDVEVARLGFGEDGEFDVELGEMGTCNFLIEILGEDALYKT
jgi:hypothetical protein